MKFSSKACVAFATLLAGAVWMGRSAEGESATPGLPVGAKAPGFSLQGGDGKAYSLDTLRQKEYLALVFYRSADW